MNDIVLLLDIGAGAGALPEITPAPVRYGSWFPVPHDAAPIPPVDGATPTPVADGVLLEWAAVEQPGVLYRIERGPTASGPWTEITRVSEPRYLVSDPSGASWHYRITPLLRGRAGEAVTVEGSSKPAPSVAELVAQQAALDAEAAARLAGDLHTALAAAADATAKADAALASATEQTDAALAQALAAATAALASATAQTDALAAEVAEIINAPEWDAQTSYNAGWLVRHAGGLYRAVVDTSGQAPDAHPAVWDFLGQYSSVAGVAAAALATATTTASDLAAEAVRLNGLIARMPSGTGTLATEASVLAEQTARTSADAVNAGAIEAVTASVAGKADASVVSAIHTRVSGLEAAGTGGNLLPNTAFNDGARLWVKAQASSTWSGPSVNLAGDSWHPPGINNLGIHSTETLASHQYGQINTGLLPVIPGQRYLASCYVANHRCTARLYLLWYDTDNVGISHAATPVLPRKWGGKNLTGWHHAVVIGTAPATAAFVRLIARFIGDGGENAYGWIIRPMLEAARATQTEPSPWVPGGLETRAGLLIESERTDAIVARLPTGTGKLAAEAGLVSEQTARVTGDATNASAISAEASRIDGLLVRMPSGTGQLATAASVTQEQTARISGDAVNAGAIEAVTASVAGKADAAVVSNIQTRVSGLEAAGHNSNLLTNTAFDSGTAGWDKYQNINGWTDVIHNMAGESWRPPGMHTLGLHFPASKGPLDSTQYGRIHSAIIPAVPGQKYIASCYLASHRCVSRLYLFWRAADTAFISAVSTPILARKNGGTSLSNWHRAVISGTAPAGAAGMQLVASFQGDGGENIYGWMLRPMLEQAGATQTDPSPWNPGGLETSAGLLIESERTDAIVARLPTGTGKLAAEAGLVSEQTARVQGDATNASAISAEASRIDGLLVRMPSGTGQLATAASVTQEQTARIAGDAANASQIQAVTASVAGKADASVVQSMGVRVGSLEAAGHGINLLPNTTFNSGARTYSVGGHNVGWSAPVVNHGGADWHPPGIHALGINTPQAPTPAQWGQIEATSVPVVPGQRLLASSYAACHRCEAQLYLMWWDAAGNWLSEVASARIPHITGGTALLGWTRLHVPGVAPAGAAFAQLVLRFFGTNQSNPVGWMLRPMLEAAGATQTEASPWNPGGMETSAEVTFALNVNNVVSGLRMHNGGQITDAAFLADVFKVIPSAGSGHGFEILGGITRTYSPSNQVIIGPGFGSGQNLALYVGPNVGVAGASKANAALWADTQGRLRIGSQRNLVQSITSGYGAVHNAAALSATAAGTVTVNAFTVHYGSFSVSYSKITNAVSGLTPGQTYVIYCDDPDYAGGVRTWFASTSIQTVMQQGDGIVVAGHIKIPTSGSGSSPSLPPLDEWCVDWDSVLPDGRLVRALRLGDSVECIDITSGECGGFPLRGIGAGWADCVRVVTASGSVIQSTSTPMNLPDGRVISTSQLLGEAVFARASGRVEPVIALEPLGRRRVVKPDFGNRMFFAGERAASCIATHNAIYKK